MRPARLVVTALALAAAGALPAVPAHAKGGVRAKLLRPVDIESAPGTRLLVRFKLESEDGHAFGASGIYLRVSRCGRRPLRIAAQPGAVMGRFSARFKVPRGGIRKLMVGLEGWRIAGGKRSRADAVFQFDPVLYSKRDCP